MDSSEPLVGLPHAYPFRLVDKVLSLNAEKGVAIKNVTYNEEFFQGHFPGKPVMPGVLIVEAMAQVAGLVLNYGKEVGQVAFLARIKEIKFKAPVFPGDRLTVEVSLDHEFASMASFKVRASVDGGVSAEGELVMAGGIE